MKYLFYISICFLWFFSACNEYPPIETGLPQLIGHLKGTVIDSITQNPISGAEIFVVYNGLGMKNESEKTIRTKTDQKGNFLIKNLPNEVLISVKKKGFKPTFLSHLISPKDTSIDIPLNGMPSIFKQFINKLDLKYASNDSSIVILEIRDLYNENKEGKANAFVHFYDLETNVNMGAVELEASFETPTYTTLRGIISANMFPKPNLETPSHYGYYYEIIDPDKIKTDYGLKQEDNLGTLQIY